MNPTTPELLHMPPPPPIIDALAQDVQARASVLQRAQLNGSALAINPNSGAGTLNVTEPFSAIAINQSALNNSALNARNTALNNSALNRSVNSNQPSRQAAVNTSVHNRTSYDNKLTNPIVRDTSRIGPITSPLPMYEQVNLPTGSQFPVGQREPNGKLTIVFWLAVLLILVEMFIMLGRYHFIALLVGLGILSLFLLNLFSSYYNKFLLLVLFLSVGFDIAWLVIKMRMSYGYSGFYSPFASLHPYLSIAIVVFVFISIAIRCVLFGLLCGFREVLPDQSYSIMAMGNELILNGPSSVTIGTPDRNYVVYPSP